MFFSFLGKKLTKNQKLCVSNCFCNLLTPRNLFDVLINKNVHQNIQKTSTKHPSLRDIYSEKTYVVEHYPKFGWNVRLHKWSSLKIKSLRCMGQNFLSKVIHSCHWQWKTVGFVALISTQKAKHNIMECVNNDESESGKNFPIIRQLTSTSVSSVSIVKGCHWSLLHST